MRECWGGKKIVTIVSVKKKKEVIDHILYSEAKWKSLLHENSFREEKN